MERNSVDGQILFHGLMMVTMMILLSCKSKTETSSRQESQQRETFCNMLNQKDQQKQISETVITPQFTERKTLQTEKNSADGQTLSDGLTTELMMKQFLFRFKMDNLSKEEFQMKVCYNTLNPKAQLKQISEIMIMSSFTEKKTSQTERNSVDGQILLDGLMMALMMRLCSHKLNLKLTSEKINSDQ